ncbi:membrane lipoprotein [Artemisia annua]|uniref:non-specific serine/threonine protein kinase n=1 Tax=Artemisia annua TaxID=35608 RepID=A0A2U1P6X2_ARTAN|nr:membrane lipoprotein [Artemisia annua]
MSTHTNIRPSLTTKLVVITIIVALSFSTTTSQTCKSTCGPVPVKYPFGTGLGCGDPRFQTRVTCTNQHLTFITHTGCYPITNIDYSNQVIYITDPSMSTCACTQPSKGFSLDWDAPFSFHDDTIFALLNCDVSSSPIFKSDSHNNTVSPVCDTGSGSRVCGLLNSCQAVSKLGIPVSTCCVYTPVDLGPSFEMDLQKLNCGSYSGLYGFKGHVDDPNSWKYGVALKYKFNFNNEYPPLCANCEKSNGVCGYGGQYNSFVCNCRTGINTTTDCFFESTWNGSPRPLPTSYGLFWAMCTFSPWAKTKYPQDSLLFPLSKRFVCWANFQNVIWLNLDSIYSDSWNLEQLSIALNKCDSLFQERDLWLEIWLKRASLHLDHYQLWNHTRGWTTPTFNALPLLQLPGTNICYLRDLYCTLRDPYCTRMCTSTIMFRVPHLGCSQVLAKKFTYSDYLTSRAGPTAGKIR